MKRMWTCGVAILAMAALLSSADAQMRVGSYQEILGQAGYAGNAGFVPTQGFQYGNQFGGQYTTGMQTIGNYNNGNVYNAGQVVSYQQGQDASLSPGTVQGTVVQGHGAVTGSVAVPPPPTNGHAVNHGAAAVNGHAVNSHVVHGHVVQGHAGHAISGPIYTDPGCATGHGTPVYVPGQYSAVAQGDCGTSACAPTFVAAQTFAQPVAVAPRVVGSTRNYVVGVAGLIFDRDFEDDVYISYNPAGRVLLSTEADTGNLSGVETFLQSRNCNGTGFEARYWGLFTQPATASLTGFPNTSLIPGLQYVNVPGTAFDAYATANVGTLHTITRSNELHNVEFNFLKNLGCSCCAGRSVHTEMLFGFRWFNFDEGFTFQSDTAAGGYASSLIYDI